MHDEEKKEAPEVRLSVSGATETTPLVTKPAKRNTELWTPQLIFMVASVNIGGFLIGYATAILFPKLSDIQMIFGDEMDTKTSFLRGCLIYATVVGAVIGAGIGGVSNQLIGRKYSILLSDVLFGFGSVLILFGPHISILFGSLSITLAIVSRLLVGIGMGLAATTIPLYLIEITPHEISGGAITIFVASQCIGELFAIAICAMIANLGIPKHSSLYWRWILVGISIPAFIHMIVIAFPDSPHWQSNQKKTDDTPVHSKVKHTQKKDFYMGVHKMSAEAAHSKATDVQNTHNKVSGVSTIKVLKTTTLVGAGLAVFQQFSGINSVVFDITTISKQMGFRTNKHDILYWIVPMITAQIVSILSTIGAIDTTTDKESRVRKPLLIKSFMYVGMASCAMMISSYIDAFVRIPILTSTFQYCSVICIYFFVVAYGRGLAAIPLTLNAEMHPDHLRGLGQSVFTMVLWLSRCASAVIYPMVSSYFGMGTAFAINCAVAFLGFFYAHTLDCKKADHDLSAIAQYLFQYVWNNPGEVKDAFFDNRFVVNFDEWIQFFDEPNEANIKLAFAQKNKAETKKALAPSENEENKSESTQKTTISGIGDELKEGKIEGSAQFQRLISDKESTDKDVSTHSINSALLSSVNGNLHQALNDNITAAHQSNNNKHSLDRCQHALNVALDEGTAHKAVSFAIAKLSRNVINGFRDNIGNYYFHPTFIRATADKNIAIDWLAKSDANVLLRIAVPTEGGDECYGTDISEFSADPTKQTIMFASHCHYRIKAVGYESLPHLSQRQLIIDISYHYINAIAEKSPPTILMEWFLESIVQMPQYLDSFIDNKAVDIRIIFDLNVTTLESDFGVKPYNIGTFMRCIESIKKDWQSLETFLNDSKTVDMKEIVRVCGDNGIFGWDALEFVATDQSSLSEIFNADPQSEAMAYLWKHLKSYKETRERPQNSK